MKLTKTLSILAVLLLSTVAFSQGVDDRQTGKNIAYRHFTQVALVPTVTDAYTDPDHVVNAQSLSAASVTCTIAAQTDVPRTLRYKVYDDSAATAAALAVLRITVTGTNQFGDTATEVFIINDTSTSANKTTTGTGVIAFATISSVVVSNTGAVDASDTLNIGLGAKIGLTLPLRSSTDLIKAYYASGGYDTFTLQSGTADYARMTYEPSTDTTSTAGVLHVYCKSSRRASKPASASATLDD